MANWFYRIFNSYHTYWILYFKRQAKYKFNFLNKAHVRLSQMKFQRQLSHKKWVIQNCSLFAPKFSFISMLRARENMSQVKAYLRERECDEFEWKDIKAYKRIIWWIEAASSTWKNDNSGCFRLIKKKLFRQFTYKINQLLHEKEPLVFSFLSVSTRTRRFWVSCNFLEKLLTHSFINFWPLWFKYNFFYSIFFDVVASKNLAWFIYRLNPFEIQHWLLFSSYFLLRFLKVMLVWVKKIKEGKFNK